MSTGHFAFSLHILMFVFVTIFNQHTVGAPVACDDLVTKSLNVTEGEDVFLNVTISRHQYFLDSIFLWKKGNEELSQCATPCEPEPCRGKKCETNGDIDSLSLNRTFWIKFDNIEFTDAGIYSFEVQYKSNTCKILETNLTVEMLVPNVSSSPVNEYINTVYAIDSATLSEARSPTVPSNFPSQHLISSQQLFKLYPNPYYVLFNISLLVVTSINLFLSITICLCKLNCRTSKNDSTKSV